MRPRPLAVRTGLWRVCMNRSGCYSGRLHRTCTRGCAGGRRKLDCQEQGSGGNDEHMVVQQVTQHRYSLSGLSHQEPIAMGAIQWTVDDGFTMDDADAVAGCADLWSSARRPQGV